MKKTRDIVRLRRWCMRRRGEGVSVSEICTSARIPRRTFYNWLNRYREGGYENLNDRPRKPNITHKTLDETVGCIIDLRRETGWCPHRIAGYLRKNGIDVCHMTVYRILCREGLNHPLTKPRTRRTYTRWQRRRSNSLWQCDVKVVDAKWLVTILVDHSYVIGSQIFEDGTTKRT